MVDINLDLTFPHEYEIEPEIDLPSSLGQVKQIYYPGAVEEGGRGGLNIEVFPYEGSPWIGIFASGYPKAFTGIFSCPNKLSLCVVSSGQAYIVRIDDPRVWEEIPLFPIKDVRVALEAQVLIFADFTKLGAYGLNGLIWITDDLSWDGLKIVEIASNSIKGLAWDSPQGKEVEFLVDIQTGNHQGGASPKKEKSN